MTDPSKTVAILVGIEKYSEGAPNLDGPAGDILCFAQWLRESGVPASQIQVILSPLEEEKSREIAKNIERLVGSELRPATDTIIDALFNEELKRLEGDLLCIYWSGHGFMDTNEQRRVVCSDATPQYLRNHNLNEILESMRTDLFPGFPRQLWVIDCCAEIPNLNGTPSNKQYQKGNPRKVVQEVLFSSAPLQISKIHPERRLSWFTLELLEHLQSLPRDGVWPPDMNPVVTHLRQRFEELRSNGYTQQVPTHFWFRNRDGGEDRVETPPTTLEVFSSYREDKVRAYIDNFINRNPSLGLNDRAVWRWLHPDTEPLQVEDLHREMRIEQPIQVFYSFLSDSSYQVRSQHPQLNLWIRRRLASLDYKLAQPDALHSDLSAVTTSLNFNLFGIMNLLHQNPLQAREKAEGIIRDALELAGQAVMQVVSAQPKTPFWTNLMLPLQPKDLRTPLFQDSTAQANIANANRLWAGCRPKISTYLVVAAEMFEGKPESLGFWLPIYSHPQNETPGATAAYYQGYASAIFADDLPRLGGDLEGADQQAWEAYITSKLLSQGSFISVPLFLKTSRDKRKVLAVLNVHFRTKIGNSEEICRRAYEGEWLRIAQRQAAPLICEAYKAFLIMHGKRRNGIMSAIDQNLPHFPL